MEEEEEEPRSETSSDPSGAAAVLQPAAEGAGAAVDKPPDTTGSDLPKEAGDDQPPADESILDAHSGDQPTSEDRLGFAPYVRAMAAFLTNPLTHPPLTLSVEGGWGCGKSSFMLQLEKELKKQNALTVWFNAWWHDKEDALWAAFALEFLKKLSKQLPWPRRVWAWLKLWALRFKWQDGWFDLLQAVVTLAAFTLASYALFKSRSYWLAVLSGDKVEGEIGKTLLTGGGLTAYLCFIIYLLTKLKNIIGNPLAINLRQHLNAPNYQSRIAFIEQFQQDFSKIVMTYAGSNKVFVFIDDLDRCEVPKAADLMQTLNMMIAGSPQLIFIVGMDREKVAAGLAVKYEKLLPYLTSAPGVKPGDKSAPDPTVGLEYGYTFIEKFIQLPFQMPYPDLRDLEGYLDEINQPVAATAKADGRIIRLRQRFARALQKQESAPAMAGRQSATGTEAAHAPAIAQSSANPPATPATATSQLTEAQRQRRETIRLAVSRDSDRVRKIALMIAPALDNNPRRIKQFINLFRLRTMIANETGLFDILDGESLEQRLTLEKLGKFVAISLRWPLLLTDLDEKPTLLNELQGYATVWYRNQFTVPAADPLPTLGPLSQRWAERHGLMRLFGKGIFIESTWQRSEEADRYDLTGLNIRRLLQVSPPVPRAAATATATPASVTQSPVQSEVADNPETTRPTFTTEELGNGVTLEMISIPKGAFLMGSPEGQGDESEKPQHPVTVSSFSIGKYPVTQAQWQAVMGNNPSEFKGENNPVEQVSWEEAVQFCQKLSEQTGKAYRLPSEAEWEYACRAGTTTQYSFGDDEGLLEQYAWYDKNSEGKTHPVGEKKPNEWGLHDLHGNVWEWCQDKWHQNYKDAPGDGRAWEEGKSDNRLLRGGSWFYDGWFCRSANRYNFAPGVRYYYLGIRVVVSARTQ
jgi:formylglycine-generating enzyme required for sulfatase activity